jgi:hypothetical protein
MTLEWMIPPEKSRACFRVITKFFIIPHALPTVILGDYLEQRRWRQRVIQEFKAIGQQGFRKPSIHKWVDVAWYDNYLDYVPLKESQNFFDTCDPGPR